MVGVVLIVPARRRLSYERCSRSRITPPPIALSRGGLGAVARHANRGNALEPFDYSSDSRIALPDGRRPLTSRYMLTGRTNV